MNQPSHSSNRLASLDFLKGLTMVLLALEATRLFEHLQPAVEGTWAATVLNQFFHHPWNGLRFWDLVQPTFMFSAGVALAYSLKKQARYLTWSESFIKTSKKMRLVIFLGRAGLCGQKKRTFL